MTKASDNLFAKLIVQEAADDGSDFSNPAADYCVLFVGEDGDLHLKSSAGTVTDFPAGGGGGTTSVGKTPYVVPTGLNNASSVDSASVTLAASGGSVALPLYVPGPMNLDHFSVWNRNTASARSAEGRLYLDNGDSTADFVTGTDATWSFTPSAASFRDASVSGVPVSLSPGTYWLVIRNTHASNTFDIGRQGGATGNVVRKIVLTQSGVAALGSSIELVTGWTGSTVLPAVALVGRVLGQSAAYFTSAD